jgi:hypothetical protein
MAIRGDHHAERRGAVALAELTLYGRAQCSIEGSQRGSAVGVLRCYGPIRYLAHVGPLIL